MDFNPEAIKNLAKDSDSYEELLKMFSNICKENNSEDINFFEGYTWNKCRNNGKSEVKYSKSVKTITGYSITELLGKPGRILSFIHEDDAPLVKTLMADFETDSSKNSIKLIYRIVKKDGSTVWVKEHLSVIRDDSGKIQKYDSIVLCVDDLKKNERELEDRATKLKELNLQKDRFISIVSHDLRSPFTSLLGFSEILLNERELSEEIQNEYLSYIYEASQNQLQMINYLLDWSRLQTGRLSIEPRRLDAFDILNNSVSVLTGNAIRKNIEIKVDVEKGLFINADERLISQCVSNLLSNAIKFTPIEKSIHVKAAKFKEGFVEIVVKDEGTGISEKNQEKIFKIDQKLSLEGTNGEKGSGLGLTLVKEIIEKHGGNIWFYSKEGEGSEFHFTIPSAQNSIVIVEDDEDQRKLYNKVFYKYFPEFEIIEANNGYEAMSVVLNDPPSLLITDHEMPLMNGTQLIDAVRKKDPKNDLPIIVVSAKLNDEIVNQYEELGVREIVKKPVESEILKKRIESLIY